MISKKTGSDSKNFSLYLYHYYLIFFLWHIGKYIRYTFSSNYNKNEILWGLCFGNGEPLINRFLVKKVRRAHIQRLQNFLETLKFVRKQRFNSHYYSTYLNLFQISKPVRGRILGSLLVVQQNLLKGNIVEYKQDGTVKSPKIWNYFLVIVRRTFRG